MEITDIRIKKVEADGKLKAYVTVTFDDCFVVHNLKIIEGQFGRFIAMPSRKTETGSTRTSRTRSTRTSGRRSRSGSWRSTTGTREVRRSPTMGPTGRRTSRTPPGA